MTADPRRALPRTDLLLADPQLQEPIRTLGYDLVRSAVVAAQAAMRENLASAPGEVNDIFRDVIHGTLARLHPVSSIDRVINATGVVLHTNLGRAPLSPAAIEAVVRASGYTDVEFDLTSGRRAGRGRGASAALRAVLPDHVDVLVVNNGAAALVLAVSALSADREVVWSRGEMVEIGDGFRLPDLVLSTGARLREVGTTNRTTVSDYVDAIGPETGCILKVHPSNYRISGFTCTASVADLASLGVTLLFDVGSGLLHPDPLFPHEPDITSALRDGAHLVIASGDKLLGGPQAGLVVGRPQLIDRLRRHPLTRALRLDKLRLAALQATVQSPRSPTYDHIHGDPEDLHRRCVAMAEAVGGEVVESTGSVGGGAAPGVPLPGWAVALHEPLAERLRQASPPIVTRVERGRCLVDLRCVPAQDDAVVERAIHWANGPVSPVPPPLARTE